jgi:hypothetical protein
MNYELCRCRRGRVVAIVDDAPAVGNAAIVDVGEKASSSTP